MILPFKGRWQAGGLTEGCPAGRWNDYLTLDTPPTVLRTPTSPCRGGLFTWPQAPGGRIRGLGFPRKSSDGLKPLPRFRLGHLRVPVDLRDPPPAGEVAGRGPDGGVSSVRAKRNLTARDTPPTVLRTPTSPCRGGSARRRGSSWEAGLSVGMRAGFMPLSFALVIRNLADAAPVRHVIELSTRRERPAKLMRQAR